LLASVCAQAFAGAEIGAAAAIKMVRGVMIKGIEALTLECLMAVHGERRAAEMEEVAETLRELGVEPLMTNATVKRQREMGEIGQQQTVRNVLDQDRAAMLGAISAAARDRH
jgi:hypothetical protein